MPNKRQRVKKSKEASFKDFFASLRYVPRFFKRIWKSSPPMFTANALARLIMAFIPIAILWIGKEIIDEVILRVNQEGVESFRRLWIG